MSESMSATEQTQATHAPTGTRRKIIFKRIFCVEVEIPRSITDDVLDQIKRISLADAQPQVLRELSIIWLITVRNQESISELESILRSSLPSGMRFVKK